LSWPATEPAIHASTAQDLDMDGVRTLALLTKPGHDIWD